MGGVASGFWYAEHADALEQHYEGLDPAALHAWWSDLLPPAGSRALDVGAGSGRDAAWLADNGLCVVAVEPCARLREAARVRHRHQAIAWIDDALPRLSAVRAQGALFDLILANAVWMHLCPNDQAAAFTHLYELLAPRGLLTLSIRFGGAPDPARGFDDVSLADLYRCVRRHGGEVVRTVDRADSRGMGIWWHNVVVRSQ